MLPTDRSGEFISLAADLRELNQRMRELAADAHAMAWAQSESEARLILENLQRRSGELKHRSTELLRELERLGGEAVLLADRHAPPPAT